MIVHLNGRKRVTHDAAVGQKLAGLGDRCQHSFAPEENAFAIGRIERAGANKTSPRLVRVPDSK